jgi:hypothetical protein
VLPVERSLFSLLENWNPAYSNELPIHPKIGAYGEKVGMSIAKEVENERKGQKSIKVEQGACPLTGGRKIAFLRSLERCSAATSNVTDAYLFGPLTG